MNIWEDITEALENYYNSKESVINVLNELQFNIHDNHNKVVSDLDETIQEYSKSNDLCSNCGQPIYYNYKNNCMECENCGYFRNM